MEDKEYKKLMKEARKTNKRIMFDNSPIGWLHRIIPMVVIPATIYFIIKFLMVALE